MIRNKLLKGFTLLEMLLVLVIATTIMGLLISYTTQTSQQNQRNKEVVQIQQILNAALAYYIQNGIWPGTAGWQTLNQTHPLISSNFLPAQLNSSQGQWTGAYLQPYQTGYDTATGNFFVSNALPSASAATPANATIVAGQVPLGITATSNSNPGAITPAQCMTGGNCYVVARVAPPGQNLATARSVNFSYVYHHGACVPAPICPTGMTPEIVVAATQVSGNTDSSNPTTAYPITSFFAYAYGQFNSGASPLSTPGAPNQIADCEAPTTTATNCASDCIPDASNPGNCAHALDASRKYWRVCLLVQTSNGQVNNAGNNFWARYSYILAITRCAPNNENAGSSFNVWTP